MSKQQKTKASRIKVKRKAWFPIIAPKEFGSKEIGETYNTSAKSAIGRTLKVNLRDLTGDVKDQNAYVYFVISNAEGNSLKTEIIGYELAPSFVKRLVRKNSDKIEGNFNFKTHKNEALVVKWVIVTLNKAKHSVQTELRKQVNSLLEVDLQKADFSGFISELVYKRSNLAIKKKLSKVYPLKELVFRMILLKPTVGGSTNEAGNNLKEAKEEIVAEAEVQEEDQTAMKA